MTERMHGVDTAGSPRRYEASRTRGGSEHEAGHGEREWVVRLQTVELAANQVDDSKGQQPANGKPRPSEIDNLAHDDPQGIALQRTEGYPDTDLAPACGHGVGHDAIQTNHRKGRGQSAEYRGKAGDQPFCFERNGNLLVNRTQVNHWNVRIQPADLFAHRLHDLSWVGPSTQIEGHEAKLRALPIRVVSLDWRRVTQILELQVFHDSDDFQVRDVLRGRLFVYKPN